MSVVVNKFWFYFEKIEIITIICEPKVFSFSADIYTVVIQEE